MVAAHFYSPWMFRSPNVYYLLLPVMGARGAAVVTLCYLSACITVLFYLLEKVRQGMFGFSAVIRWFSLWLVFFLIGLPKFQLSQYWVLVFPGIIAYLCERFGHSCRKRAIAGHSRSDKAPWPVEKEGKIP
jgi:hypothetical protein